MITDQDTEIIEKEESTHLRLTPEFMKSIGVEVVDTWTHDLIVHMTKDMICLPFVIQDGATERHILMSYKDFVGRTRKTKIIGKTVWCNVNGFRLIGVVNHYNLWSKKYSVIVERVNKL